MRIDRADLERLTSAATAFTAMQRVAQQQRIGSTEVTFSTDSLTTTTITVAAVQADLDALEQAVIRTRRLLGWRS